MDPDNAQPTQPQDKSGQNQALKILRSKIDELYGAEPPAQEELQQLQNIAGNKRQLQASKFAERKITPPAPTQPQEPSKQTIRENQQIKPKPNLNRRSSQKLSKHQQFMADLQNSGKTLPEIQTAWHQYYTNLDDRDKHQVWREFYAQSNQSKQQATTTPQSNTQVFGPQQTNASPQQTSRSLNPVQQQDKSLPLSTYGQTKKNVAELKGQLIKKIGERKEVSKGHNLKSLAFGLGMGCLAILVLSFGFFNERFIAPFITPSRTVTSTPIIIDGSTQADGPESKIIIPKINVEAPIVFGQNSIEEDAVQNSLEDGVLHYGITSQPGELGNSVYFGHSSNNLLNKGKYKFIFVLLSKLEAGDTFMVQKDGNRYVYKVYDKKIVAPTNLSVLEPDPNKPAIATLITCDPPGTVTNRLVVFAEQISPKPNQNVASSARDIESNSPEALPSDAPSLWSRIRNWFSSS